MSCYEECNDFLNSSLEEDLGDIRDQGSCSYCLYWNGNGPGAEGDIKKRECKCDDLFENLTNFGTTYNLNIHNKVKNCLQDNIKSCGKLYKQFTNPDKPYDGPRFGLVDGMWGRLERYQEEPDINRFRDYAQNSFKEKIETHPYGYYNQCTGKRASPGFHSEGVL